METNSVNKARVRRMLLLIQGEIRRVERKLICREIDAPDVIITDDCLRIFRETNDVYLKLAGEHEPIYHGTPAEALANYLDELKNRVELPESVHFADPGSGLGRPVMPRPRTLTRSRALRPPDLCSKRRRTSASPT